MIKEMQSVLLKDTLKPEDVYFVNDLKTRQELIKFGSQKIHPLIKGICSNKVLYERLAEVDKLNNVLDNGFFIPHAKFSDLKELCSVLLLSPQGVKDDRSETRIFVSFLFLSPLKPSFFQTHLNLLSHVARIFRKEFITEISALKTPAEVYAAILNAEK
ncbi:MAG: hypothetical protein COT17_04910 [Elusimicrobia bacterium CG08_land_8_20_14_0_20_51_18]|nr:MAG: hypothetical protein COT17_04910 [Elusimicrobia bacterium CG08_land_8_20_14_0_20_51_18]